MRAYAGARSLCSAGLSIASRRANGQHAGKSTVQNNGLSSVAGDTLDFAGAVAFAQEFHDALLLLDGQRVHAKSLCSRMQAKSAQRLRTLGRNRRLTAPPTCIVGLVEMNRDVARVLGHLHIRFTNVTSAVERFDLRHDLHVPLGAVPVPAIIWAYHKGVLDAAVRVHRDPNRILQRIYDVEIVWQARCGYGG